MSIRWVTCAFSFAVLLAFADFARAQDSTRADDCLPITDHETEVSFRPFSLGGEKTRPEPMWGSPLYQDRKGDLFQVDGSRLTPLPRDFVDALKAFGPVSHIEKKPSGDFFVSYFPPGADRDDMSAGKAMLWSSKTRKATDLTSLIKRMNDKDLASAEIISAELLVEHSRDGSLWETNPQDGQRRKVHAGPAAQTSLQDKQSWEFMREIRPGIYLLQRGSQGATYPAAEPSGSPSPEPSALPSPQGTGIPSIQYAELINTKTGKAISFQTSGTPIIAPDGKRLLIPTPGGIQQIESESLEAKTVTGTAGAPLNPYFDFMAAGFSQPVDSERLILSSPGKETLVYDFKKNAVQPLDRKFQQVQPSYFSVNSFPARINPYLTYRSERGDLMLADMSAPAAEGRKLPGCGSVLHYSPNGRYVLCSPSDWRSGSFTWIDLETQQSLPISTDPGPQVFFVEDDGSVLAHATDRVSEIKRLRNFRARCIPLSRRIEPEATQAGNCATCEPSRATEQGQITSALAVVSVEELCSNSYDREAWSKLIGDLPDSGTYPRKQAVLLLKELQKPGAWNTRRHLPLLLALGKSDFPKTDPALVTRAMLAFAVQDRDRFNETVKEYPYLLRGEPDRSCETIEERQAFSKTVGDSLLYGAFENIINSVTSLEELSTVLKPLLPYLRQLDGDSRKNIRQRLQWFATSRDSYFSSGDGIDLEQLNLLRTDYGKAWLDATLPETRSADSKPIFGAEKSDVHVMGNRFHLVSTKAIAGYGTRINAGLHVKTLDWTPTEQQPSRLLVWQSGGRIYRKRLTGTRSGPEQPWTLRVEEIKP